ncbi:AMP-binding protein, partial [Chitinophaga varians]|uniref:AMP-binding protein n=1 Tax=Chitinophaga varians TaxID=2202339 RepID=UPI00165FDDA1
KPLLNENIFILDDNTRLSPVGVAGEICIGGAGVARGYLNLPVLTAERFIANPVNPGSKLYRTGDLGYWLPDGNIVFVRRKDDQVKIRG